jgi:hypothetical protein
LTLTPTDVRLRLSCRDSARCFACREFIILALLPLECQGAYILLVARPCVPSPKGGTP